MRSPTLWQRFCRWQLERRIRSVERRILDQQRERTTVDDIIAYHRGQIAKLQKQRAMLS